MNDSNEGKEHHEDIKAQDLINLQTETSVNMFYAGILSHVLTLMANYWVKNLLAFQRR